MFRIFFYFFLDSNRMYTEFKISANGLWMDFWLMYKAEPFADIMKVIPRN